MNDDEQLLKRMRQGDREAANTLIARYYDDIFRYCLWHTATRSMAEDATQETFLKLIRYCDRYIAKGHFRAFLYRIAVNTCIDFGRAKASTTPPLPEDIDTVADNGQDFETLQDSLSLHQMVTDLPETQQQLVLLRYLHDLSLREIAEITDLPLRTVQSRLRTALKKLRKNYEKGVTP